MIVSQLIKILESYNEYAEVVMADYSPVIRAEYDETYGDGVVILTDEEEYEDVD